MRILNIVETAYRGTLEEQDDAALWVVHALKNCGSDMSVLLRGNAVNYAIAGQDSSSLSVAGCLIEHAPNFDAELAKMKAAGIDLRVVREDVLERGMALDRLTGDCVVVSRAQLADLVSSFDLVWHW